MVTEDYVSFETAKLLKENGFSDTSGNFTHYYSKDGKCSVFWTKGACPAPTLQMAMKWLREVHCTSIDIVSWWDGDKEEYYYTYLVTKPGRTLFEGKREFHKHSQACEVAIKYCLENLI